MAYKISQVADMLGLPASTIRYYDKEGLLPHVERGKGGQRVFSEQDLEMLRAIESLKKTGMSIKDIHQFSQWMQRGDDTIPQRLSMLRSRKEAMQAQIEQLEDSIRFVEARCRIYEDHLAGQEGAL